MRSMRESSTATAQSCREMRTFLAALGVVPGISARWSWLPSPPSAPPPPPSRVSKFRSREASSSAWEVTFLGLGGVLWVKKSTQTVRSGLLDVLDGMGWVEFAWRYFAPVGCHVVSVVFVC
jgi:hypothetical protein